MKNIICGLAVIFGTITVASCADVESWGKFENDSLRIEKENIQQAVIRDDLFDEFTKDELTPETKVSKNIKSKKTLNKLKQKSRKKSKRKR